MESLLRHVRIFLYAAGLALPRCKLIVRSLHVSMHPTYSNQIYPEALKAPAEAIRFPGLQACRSDDQIRYSAPRGWPLADNIHVLWL